MSLSDLPVTRGMGNAVPGGPETTGVLLGSPLPHAANTINNRQQPMVWPNFVDSIEVCVIGGSLWICFSLNENFLSRFLAKPPVFLRREGAVRQERDTLPQPIFPGQQAGNVLNRRDGKDCLSTRWDYRRLDTSSLSRASGATSP